MDLNLLLLKNNYNDYWFIYFFKKLKNIMGIGDWGLGWKEMENAFMKVVIIILNNG